MTRCSERLMHTLLCRTVLPNGPLLPEPHYAKLLNILSGQDNGRRSQGPALACLMRLYVLAFCTGQSSSSATHKPLDSRLRLVLHVILYQALY